MLSSSKLLFSYLLAFLLHRGKSRLIVSLLLGIGVVLSCQMVGLATSGSLVANVRVDNTPIGLSTRYIGTCEGNVNFDSSDMTDLGINTYRIYGGMSRWETDDDNGIYGFPTIAQIKNNPELIPWEHWDAVMTNPPTGTDYAFSGNPQEMWQGSARTIFEILKQENIRPVLTIRNSDPGWQPDWALQLNPPRTTADWNEWWEHVFATVYWLNVRNDYGVDDFEIHNEPDNRQQGWGGNQADYFKLVQVARDAIDYAYSTYLTDRTYHIHAPVTIGGSSWVYDALQTIPESFDSINIHNYADDISLYAQQVRQWANETIHADSPIWLGEWGSYTAGYDDLAFSLDLIKNLVRASQPGLAHIYGSHIFSLYDWCDEGGFAGLINAKGERRLSYYAFRMGIRALQGGRTMLSTATSAPEIMAITTQDDQQQTYLLLLNSAPTAQHIVADVSSLIQQGAMTHWEFSEQIHDQIVGQSSFYNGIIELDMPAQSGDVIMIRPEK